MRGPTTKGRASARPISASHQTSNLLHQTCPHGSVQLSLCPHFHRSGLGNDAGSGRRRRDAAGALASTALLGAYVWVANLFLYLVVAWWIFYRWRNQQPWTFFLFIFVLISPTILYLASIILFPPESAPDEFVNYKTHYYSTHRAFFTVFGLFTPVDIVDSLLKGLPHFLALGPLYFISGALFFAGLVTAAITRNERYHRCYAIIFLAQTTVISFTIFRTLI